MIPHRLLTLLLFFAVISGAYAFRAVMLAGPQRQKILNEAEKISRKYYRIPARRGKICDRNGTVLVWSEHYYDLWLRNDFPGSLETDEAELLKSILPDIQLDTPGKRLKSHLKPKELEALAPLLSGTIPIEIRQRHERLKIRSEAVHRLAGKTGLDDGNLCGTSGWELQYELQLRGVPGRYSIMLDRFQHSIPGTFQLHTSPVAGKDILLPETLEEIEQKSTSMN